MKLKLTKINVIKTQWNTHTTSTIIYIILTVMKGEDGKMRRKKQWFDLVCNCVSVVIRCNVYFRLIAVIWRIFPPLEKQQQKP